MVKSLIGGNLIHLVVLETSSPGRQGLRQSVCHLLYVYVRVIHAPGAFCQWPGFMVPFSSFYQGIHLSSVFLRPGKRSCAICFSICISHMRGLCHYRYCSFKNIDFKFVFGVQFYYFLVLLCCLKLLIVCIRSAAIKYIY